LFTKFNTKTKTIFLDPNSTKRYSSIDSKKLNIILSPSLYWIKKIELPLKYAKDAKKLLPSLFEDTLPNGNYSYSVYKEENEFFIFAYEDKLILETLSKFGISLSNVQNVYFAQSEMQNLKGATKINETQSMYIKDGIVILVPSSLIKESVELDVSQLPLSKHKIFLQQYAHIVKNNDLYKLGAVLLLFCILICAEYFITTQKTSQVLKLKDELFVKHKLKPTMMQNISILKKYKITHQKQTKLREYILYALSFKLKKSEKLTKLNLKDKSINTEFSDISKETLSHMKQVLASKKVKFTAIIKDKTLHLEMML